MPLAPTRLRIQKITEDFVNVTWRAPPESARGRTIAYELSYKPNQTECLLFKSIDPILNCHFETVSHTLEYVNMVKSKMAKANKKFV